MCDPTDTAALRDRALAELLEIGLETVREARSRLAGAETIAEASEMILAVQRMSRSVRQTLALQEKFERGRRQQEREDRDDGRREQGKRVDQRKKQVRLAVERLVWTEAEGEDAERLSDELDDLLEAEALSDGFLDAPVEVLIARIRQDLGLDRPPPPKKPKARPAKPVHNIHDDPWRDWRNGHDPPP